MSDLPSQYAEEVETFRQILVLPGPRDTLPRSPTTLLGLDDEKSIKYIKPTASTAKYYKVGQPCFEDKLQELNTDFSKSVSPQSPLGKVPLQVLKELEHQARQNFSTTNFMAIFPRTASCNTVMEKCQHSIKTTFKRVKNQIQKSCQTWFENACDYFEIMNKRILIQQRALACLSKSVAHILQRELYTMGNTGLLRREAEMTLLQPYLGDSRPQELRNSPFWPSPLFTSQLVKDGEDFLLKKGTPKALYYSRGATG